MRVVVDTNVLIAGLIADGLCRDIVKRRLTACELVTSRWMLNELEQKLRNKFDVDPKTLPFLEVFEARATIVAFRPLSRRVCRDADDDNVLATAVAGNAAIILTGDKDLLVLQEFKGVKILSPRQFVELLDETASRPKL